MLDSNQEHEADDVGYGRKCEQKINHVKHLPRTRVAHTSKSPRSKEVLSVGCRAHSLLLTCRSAWDWVLLDLLEVKEGNPQAAPFSRE
jgi:hypothetical protein